MKEKSLLSTLSGIFSVALLVFSVFAGVTLVKKEQDLRRQAAQNQEHKVTICHKTGSDTNTWEEIEVSENAVNSHLSHGDIIGNCPSQGGGGEEPTPTPVVSSPTITPKEEGPTSTPIVKDQEGESVGGTGGTSNPPVIIQNVTVINQVIQAPQIETKYIYVTTGFDFRIKFEEIDSKKPDKLVRLMFRGVNDLHVYNKVTVVADKNGVYHGVIPDIRPGTYDVFVKGEGYLQRKFSGIIIRKGNNYYNWTKSELLAGDFNGDNKLTPYDIAEFLSFFRYDINPTDSTSKVFDLDMNDHIDLEDLNIVTDNFISVTVFGED